MRVRVAVAVGVAAMGLRAAAVDKKVVLDTERTWNGDAIRYLETRCPEVELVLVTIHPGEATGVHLHPVNNYAYVVKGTVSLESGRVDAGGRFIHDARYKAAEFTAGQGFAELVDVWHNGKNNGTEDVQILVWYTSEQGLPVTVAWATDPGYAPEKHPRDGSRCTPKPPPAAP